MSNPSQPDPTIDPLNYEDVLDEILHVIDNNPGLEPLRAIVSPDQPIGKAEEERVAFAGVFQTVRLQLDSKFDKQFDNDVPNELKPLIESYGEAPDKDTGKPHPDPETILSPEMAASLSLARPLPMGIVASSISLRSALANLLASDEEKEVTPLPIPPTIPLPPSPMFHDLAKTLVEKAVDFPKILEGDGKPMKYVPALPFENWGLTVSNKPSFTFIARTEVGLRNLVKWAAGQTPKKKVRVAGYRHTWTDFYSSDNEVLVMLLPLEVLIELPSYSPTMQAIQQHSDLVGIEVPPMPLGASPKTTLCTIKAGTTNEMFRAWCLENRLWCIPFNVIMVEITFGGSNGPICHGAGLGSTTLSDLVEEFHYIDSNGNSKSITDREQLRAASGCFGLLGICTAVTLRLDAMEMAVMNPVKLPLPLAIPPPPGFPVPSQINMEEYTPGQLEDARLKFIRRCEEDYYLEWFWFPLTDQVWVNTWNKEPADQATLNSLEPYPSRAGALVQWGAGWAAEQLINTWGFKHLFSPKAQTWLLAHIALKTMPDVPRAKDAIKTLVSEALHFRRGVQNMRVLDSEWEIPIPAAPNSTKTRDYEKVQWAWWDAIKLFYDRIDDAPMRLTLEMRLTGGSNVLLAPQRDNELGTISIEALTTTITPPEVWKSFLQQLVDKWAGYRDSQGQLLNTRPHWAKEWQGLTVRGQPAEKYLKETAYKTAIPEFVTALEKIAQAQGTTVSDMRAMFGNPLLERLIFGS